MRQCIKMVGWESNFQRITPEEIGLLKKSKQMTVGPSLKSWSELSYQQHKNPIVIVV